MPIASFLCGSLRVFLRVFLAGTLVAMLASSVASAADLGLGGPSVTLTCRLPTTARAFGVNTYFNEEITFTILRGKKAVLDASGTPMSVKEFTADEINAVDLTGRILDYNPQTGELTAVRYVLPGGEVVGLGHCSRAARKIIKY